MCFYNKVVDCSLKEEEFGMIFQASLISEIVLTVIFWLSVTALLLFLSFTWVEVKWCGFCLVWLKVPPLTIHTSLNSVVSDSWQTHGLCSARLLCPWGFPRQEYWSALPSPPPGDFLNPGTEPRSPALQAESLPSEPPGGAPELRDRNFFQAAAFLLWHPGRLVESWEQGPWNMILLSKFLLLKGVSQLLQGPLWSLLSSPPSALGTCFFPMFKCPSPLSFGGWRKTWMHLLPSKLKGKIRDALFQDMFTSLCLNSSFFFLFIDLQVH